MSGGWFWLLFSRQCLLDLGVSMGIISAYWPGGARRRTARPLCLVKYLRVWRKMGTGIKIAVLASGRGSNFKALAEATSDESFPAKTVLLIVDNPDAGALAYASKSGIAAEVVDCGSRKGSMTPESSESMAEICARHEIDLICLAGSMRIVKGELLDRHAGRSRKWIFNNCYSEYSAETWAR